MFLCFQQAYTHTDTPEVVIPEEDAAYPLLLAGGCACSHSLVVGINLNL